MVFRRRVQRLNRGGFPTVASLYSGCGGLDKGFEWLGFLPLGASDIDRAAVRHFNQNVRPVARVLDLGERTPDHESPDVLLAGSPCQGFSTAGKRLISDPRNQLLFRAGEIAVQMRPKVFILENVPAALSGRHREHWVLVEDMLRWHGFNVRIFFANGLESGIAQIRKRIFLVGWKGSDCIRVEPEVERPLTLADVLNGVENIIDHNPLPIPTKSREGLIARRIQPGQKLSNVRAGSSAVHTWHIPEVYGSVNKREVAVLEAVLSLRRRNRIRDFGDGDPVLVSAIGKVLGWSPRQQVESLIAKRYLRKNGHRVELVHTYNGKFRRLKWEGVSPTVDTHFGDPALFLHPSEDRGFTPREAARIQGFPDEFTFLGSRTVQFRMIGNAVPPPMAARLAKFVRTALL